MTHAVIFDIDGTLLNSSAQDDHLYKQAARKVLGDVRFRPGLADYQHVTDAGILLEVCADNGIAADPALTDAVKTQFFADLEAFIDDHGPFLEMPGAQALLERLLRSDDHGIAIATGSWRRSAEIKLASAGFALDGVTVANSDDAIERTAIMQHALASIGRDCRSITYFGDGSWDRLACDALGWRFRAVGPGLNGIASFDGEYDD